MNAQNLLMAIVMILFLQPDQLNAQPVNVKTCKMTVKGSSTLHDWESMVEKLTCKTSYKIQNHTLTDIHEAVIEIPVISIKSSKGNMMDGKTHDAFNYEKFPFITFRLQRTRIDGSGSAEITGTLTMAGTTNLISMVIHYAVLPNDDLQITGSKEIMMTDFNMVPPTAVMGTIKVEDKVTVTFDMVLSTTAKTTF